MSPRFNGRMRNIVLLICMGILSVNVLYAQNKKEKEFDKEFYKIAVKLSTKNPAKALRMADSIYYYSRDKEYRAKALLLSSSIFGTQGNIPKSLENAQKALDMAKEINDYDLQASIYGSMAMIYEKIGFLDSAKEYMDEGIKASNKIQDEQRKNIFAGHFNSSLAEFALGERDYKKSIVLFSEARTHYEQIEQTLPRNYLLAIVEGGLGRAFMEQMDYETALPFFRKAIDYHRLAEGENSLVAASYYQSLGIVYLKLSEPDSSYSYLMKAKTIVDYADNSELKENVYGSLVEYFEKTELSDSVAYYTKEYLKFSEGNKEEGKKSINYAHKSLESKDTEDNHNSAVYKWLLFILGGIGLTGGLVYLISKKDTRIKRTGVRNYSHAVSMEATTEDPTIILSDKVRKEIRERIKKFEDNEEYLKANLTFPAMVSKMDTNSKYLHYFLKEEYDKDYSTYINDLRINYIINKLKNEPVYRKYKISYLGEKCGFSSYNNFTKNFKRVATLTPSQFLKVLN